MIRVGIIGVGALGERHLQSVLHLGEQVQVWAVESRMERIDELRGNYQEVNFFDSIQELPKKLDVVVIATSSNVRRTVFEELLKTVEISYIVFEKVLFQKIEDYTYVAEELKKHHIRAWVNCARREWPSYQKVQKEITASREVSISVVGGEWGLACNGIHMLDLVQFLERNRCEIVNANLKNEVVESKRKGFFEVYGSLNGTCGPNGVYQITCMKESALPIQIDVQTDRARYCISEQYQIMRVSRECNQWEEEIEEFPIMYQSQLTEHVVLELMETGTCFLPDFQESMELHQKFLATLLEVFEKNGMEKGICPIT